jgi:hypothetical protein
MAEERILTRHELFDLVWSKPMQQLAREFKLSDVGMAKTCKRHNIPRPSRGHWQKLAVGKAPKQPKLPPSPDGVEQIRFSIPDDPVPQPQPVLSPEVAAWIEREHDPKNKITVAAVGKYHPLVRSAKDALEAKREWYGVDDGWRSSGRGTVWVRVTKAVIGRACRLLNALLAAFEARNFRVSYSRQIDNAVVHVLGQEFKISLVERQKRIAHTPTKEELEREKRGLGGPRKYDDIPSSQLRLTLEYAWRKLQFEDGKVPLEEQLNDVALILVRTVIEVIKPELERRAKEEEQRREEEHERWLFQQKCDRFDDGYCAWHAQQERLRFVSVLEEAAAKLEHPSDRVKEFVAWTRRYVEWADPLPDFFEGIEKDEHVHYHEFTRR